MIEREKEVFSHDFQIVISHRHYSLVTIKRLVLIVTSSATGKKLEIYRNLENKLEIFEFFVNGR